MKQSLEKLTLERILIVCLIIILLFTTMCNGNDDTKEIIKVNGEKYELLKHTIDTVKIPVDTIVYKPGKTIYKDKPIYVEVPTNVDTTAILKDYFSINVYKDTLKLKDNLGTITITDSISKNKIKGRLWDASINKEIVKETIIVKELPKNQVYIGGLVGAGATNGVLNFVGPSILLKTKQDKLYNVAVGYGLDSNLYIQAGIHWKIKLKK
jgi:hypothetical protein